MMTNVQWATDVSMNSRDTPEHKRLDEGVAALFSTLGPLERLAGLLDLRCLTRVYWTSI